MIHTEPESVISTCDIADGMVLCGFESGGELPYLTQQSGDMDETIHGRAYTVEIAPLSDPRPAVTGHYIDFVPPKSVIVIATSPECHLPTAPYTSMVKSLYGGLMSHRARQLGAKGAVVLGRIRDLPEQRSLGFPVFSYGVGACAANRSSKVVRIDGPLDVGFNRVIHSGDHVFADSNGVVVVPADVYDQVIHKSLMRSEANKNIAMDIETGKECQRSQVYWRQQYS